VYLNFLTQELVGPPWVHRANAAEPYAYQAGVMAKPRRVERNP
jgi:hypothetical protein